MDAARIPPLENRGDQLNAVPEVGARWAPQAPAPMTGRHRGGPRRRPGPLSLKKWRK